MQMKKYKLGEICENITDGEHGTVVDSPDGEYFLSELSPNTLLVIKKNKKYYKRQNYISCFFLLYAKIQNLSKLNQKNVHHKNQCNFFYTSLNLSF